MKRHNKKTKEGNRLARNEETSQPPKEGFFASLMKIVDGVKKIVDAVTNFNKAVGAIVLAFGYLYGCFGHTKTAFAVLGTDGDSIIVKASIAGPKLRWSKLIDYRVSFGDLPIEDAPLKLVKGEETEAVVTSISSGLIRLTVPGLRGRCRAPQEEDLPDRYDKEEIMSQIPAQPATLTINVRESNGEIRKLNETVPIAAIKGFILRHLPDHVPEKTSCS